MAGSARYTAVLDANVLYPALLRDILLSLAHADLYSAKRSAHIREEWSSSLLRDKPQMKAQIAAAAVAMEEAIPDCLVAGYEHVLRERVIPFGHAGYVALFGIEDAATVTFLAVRHPLQDDYH